MNDELEKELYKPRSIFDTSKPFVPDYIHKLNGGLQMSDEMQKLSSKIDKSKWYSIITAIIVLVQTIVDIVLR